MSEYTLYTDREENFNCEIAVEGARLRDSFARIILESEDMSLVFKGTIDSNGKCSIPIKKMKGLLDESTKGAMKLEVVAEDVYFQPWQSEFIIETAKKLSVEVISQSKETNSKPKITISEVQKNLPKPKTKKIIRTTQPIAILVNGLSKRGITVENISKKKKEILPFLERYAEKIGVDKNKLVSEVVYRLSNKK